jgi:hypothetical protein
MFHRAKKVTMQDPKETTPLIISAPPPAPMPDTTASSEEDNMDGTENFQEHKADSVRRESLAADRLSMRLLQVEDDDSETEDLILKESLNISFIKYKQPPPDNILSNMQEATRQAARERLVTMIGLLIFVFCLIIAALWVGVEFIGPPNQPVGPYELVERQVRYVRREIIISRETHFRFSRAYCTQSYRTGTTTVLYFRREPISLIFIPFM